MYPFQDILHGPRIGEECIHVTVIVAIPSQSEIAIG